MPLFRNLRGLCLMKIFLAINIPGYSTIQFKVIQNEKRKKTVLIPKKIYEILQRFARQFYQA